MKTVWTCRSHLKINAISRSQRVTTSSVTEWHTRIVKADSHIAFRAHAVPMPFVNSHMPCRAPALLRQCRVLRESSHGSQKYPNCQSRSLTERLFCSVLLLLCSSSMINVIWFHTGHLNLRVVCY
jgi:hypothetical protein